MFAFAPFRIFPLAIIGIILLLVTLENTSPKTGAFRGWLFGLGLFGSGIYWIFISMTVYGHLQASIALVLTVAFSGILALFPALSGYWLNRFFPHGQTTRLLLAFPALWMLSEWLRSLLFTGFPWLTLGSSQILSPLKGYAPLFGVSGVSLAIVLSAGLLLKAFHEMRQKSWHEVWRALMIFTLLWGAGSVLAFIPWTHPKGSPIQVSLVQGNIPENLKWSADMIQPTLDIYSGLSKSHWDSDIVIWPESAIPDFLGNQQDFINKMDATARKNHTTFITGIPIRKEDQGRYFNAVVAFGNGTGYYLKHRLVPFGEYIPFEKYLSGLLDILHIPLSGFVPDPHPAKPLLADQLKISTFICYEAAFPEQVRFRDPDISLLLTVSNDGWFGHSTAQAQHLEMAAMRALETGRPMLMVANDGPTAIINATGQIMLAAPAHQPFVLTGWVQPMQGKTPWLYFGMDPILMLSFVLLFKAWRNHRKANRLIALETTPQTASL